MAPLTDIARAELDRSATTWLGSQINPTAEQINLAEKNGRLSTKRHERRFAKWAKKHPKEAASILKEQARYEAASAEERQSILDENNDSIGRVTEMQTGITKPVFGDVVWDSRAKTEAA